MRLLPCYPIAAFVTSRQTMTADSNQAPAADPIGSELMRTAHVISQLLGDLGDFASAPPSSPPP
jgi:hypothetical protein